jgi:hypothetical protein
VARDTKGETFPWRFVPYDNCTYQHQRAVDNGRVGLCITEPSKQTSKAYVLFAGDSHTRQLYNGVKAWTRRQGPGPEQAIKFNSSECEVDDVTLRFETWPVLDELVNSKPGDNADRLVAKADVVVLQYGQWAAADVQWGGMHRSYMPTLWYDNRLRELMGTNQSICLRASGT